MRRKRKSKKEVLQARREIQRRASEGLLVVPAAVKELRDALDMTQAEFARTFRMTRQQVILIETGKANPTFETLTRIMRPFGLTLGVIPIVRGDDDDDATVS
jgi:DNA-binding XRE family transcriptional regulator